jgi:hypothetical protein
MNNYEVTIQMKVYVKASSPRMAGDLVRKHKPGMYVNGHDFKVEVPAQEIIVAKVRTKK